MKSRFLTVAASCLLWAGIALGQVNINTATPEQLDSLKGIGEARAKAIIKYREENGPFKSVSELKNVPNFPDSLVGKLRGKITVSGASSIPESAPAKAAPRKESVATPSARPAAPASRPQAEAPKPSAPAAVRPLEKPAIAEPARPAAPGMPAKPMSETKAMPATPAAPEAKPAAPAVKPAAPAVKPAGPAVPAAPAKPAQPAASY